MTTNDVKIALPSIESIKNEYIEWPFKEDANKLWNWSEEFPNESYEQRMARIAEEAVANAHFIETGN